MISQTAPIPDLDLVPQAIFARSICYFTANIEEGTDDLDSFEGAAFALDNDVHFSLRHYRGHRAHTVTFYLEYKVDQLEDIDAILRRVITAFQLSNEAVLWKRGEDFRPGHLRVSTERLSEREARILVLKIAAVSDGNRATTTHIKDEIPKYFPLTETDRRPYPSRGREPRWRQIVGNVISHKPSSTSIFSKGFARPVGGYLQVTRQGIDYLNSIGFSVARDL